MEDAFNDTRQVLKKLSNHSPQAQEYYEILTNFSDAISRNRQRLALKKRQASKQYVKQLFTFGDNPGIDQQHVPTISGSSLPLDIGASDAYVSGGLGRNLLPVQLDGGLDYGFGDGMQIPEGFAFDLEPFGMFFETM